jgi:hypothetical protein
MSYERYFHVCNRPRLSERTTMQIELEKLQELIGQISYKTTGAITEKEYEHYLSKEFPNSEFFWKSFIVPFTNRVYPTLSSNQLFTSPRERVSPDLHEIGSFHYSIFLNLIYAHKIMETRHFSFFENFYMHLGSVCDLVEEFLIKIYLLILECRKIESTILEKLTKEQFLELAGKWYEKNYSNLHEQYYKNGRPNPIRLPNRSYVLNEYFGEMDSWAAYKSFSGEVRQYRNVIVHHYKIAGLQDAEGYIYVPLKSKISLYKKWLDVEEALKDSNKHKDFISQNTLMAEDIKEIKIILQNLWEKPIKDMDELLFIKKNETLLAKYDLLFV